MKKQLLIIGILAIFVGIGLSGCTDNKNGPSIIDDERFLGRWTTPIIGTNETFIFYFWTNMSLSVASLAGMSWTTYTITDNNTLVINDYGEIITYEYSFSDDNKTLTLILVSGNGSDVILTR